MTPERLAELRKWHREDDSRAKGFLYNYCKVCHSHRWPCAVAEALVEVARLTEALTAAERTIRATAPGGTYTEASPSPADYRAWLRHKLASRESP